MFDAWLCRASQESKIRTRHDCPNQRQGRCYKIISTALPLIIDYLIGFGYDDIMFNRKIDFKALLQKKSFFLFGARSTGKSFWLRESLGEDVLFLNLLSSELFLRLSENPAQLEEIIRAQGKKKIAIDEIQKIPALLDEVHRLIEDSHYKFILTGSSARALKRKHANMLGGRANLVHFYPLSFAEIPQFDLQKYLSFGGLPRIYLSEDPLGELESYLTTYIEQEVKLEANIRNLGPFHRFLKTAALCNAELINYANIASDSGVPATTVKEYYSILEDSLLGIRLEPWIDSKKRKAIQTSKFYFFDTGVCNYISGRRSLERSTDAWGKAFEQFILIELKAFISYTQKRRQIYFWRSQNKQEVDFILDDEIGIEVKSTKKVQDKHLNGIRALKEEKILKKYFVISEDPIARLVDKNIEIMPWRDFLKKLWKNEIF